VEWAGRFIDVVQLLVIVAEKARRVDMAELKKLRKENKSLGRQNGQNDAKKTGQVPALIKWVDPRVGPAGRRDDKPLSVERRPTAHAPAL
jgi:hypothetical protein